MYRLVWLILVSSVSCLAQRDPVLKQIDLPHPYYFREMYLPQVTTGPSAAAWSPDSKSLVYSMAGSLWRQKLNTARSEQLTADTAYDYQPDWSSDGRWIVFTRYAHDAVELWSLDLTSGRTQQMTSGGAVNVEPRFSPDGKRLAFVSTSYQGHFHIFIAQFEMGSLKDGGNSLQRTSVRCHGITTARWIMRSVLCGRGMVRKSCSFPTAGIFMARADSGR